MKRIDVKLNLDVVAPLLDVMKAAADDLGLRLAIDINMPGDDNEFKDGWESELLDGQTGDLRVLLGLFDSEFFVTGTIAFDPVNCEPILRACAALRLRLRAAHLLPLGDENLESGEVPFDQMTEAQRKAFAAYAFLATLQELLVEHLDPNLPPE